MTDIIPSGPVNASNIAPNPDKSSSNNPNEIGQAGIFTLSQEYVDLISLGQRPLTGGRENEVWESLKISYRTHYDPLGQWYEDAPIEPLTAQLGNAAFSLEADFQYQRDSQREDFSYLHVESTLNQTADLLDRCIQERIVWEGHAAKALSVALEIKDFLHIDLIHAEEIRAGMYTIPFEVISRQLEGLKQSSSAISDARSSYWELITSMKARNPQVDEASQRISFLPYATDTQTVSWDGQHATRASFAINATSILSNWEQHDLSASRYSEAYNLDGQAASASGRTAAAEARAKWDRADIDFKRRRTEVAREIAQLKIRLACLQDGAVNYSEQREKSKRRFDRDFRDALDRYPNLLRGLSEIYNYPDTDPLQNMIRLGETTREDLEARPFLGKLDLYLTWVRNAIAWMVRFQAREFSYVHVVSTRHSCADEQLWLQGRDLGLWTINLADDVFAGKCHVRLRGITAFAVTQALGSLWKVSLNLPERGLIRRLDGSVLSLDQTHLPQVLLGRVSGRESIRNPVTADLSTIHNASPSGLWVIEVSPIDGGAMDRLEDLHIEIEIAARIG